MVECKHCKFRWRVSEAYVDDGNELICPRCGSTFYRWDASDEIDGDKLEDFRW